MTVRAAVASVTILCLAACGGGADADAGLDAGPADAAADAPPHDAGHDAGFDAAPPVDFGPPDMGILEVCDYTATPSLCAATDRCAITSRDSPVDGGMRTYTLGECVPRTGTSVTEGSTCGTGFATVAGHPDVRADTCGEGTYCARTPASATVSRCFRTCDDTHPCRAMEYCYGQNTSPHWGVCVAVSNCDVLRQTGCRAGQGCYTLRDSARNTVATCLGDRSSPDAGPCYYVNDCAAGSTCRNRTLADGGRDSFCAPYCDLSGGDAGTPVDAGYVDAGDVDAGDIDAGDAGDVDAGPSDGGAPIVVPPCVAPRTCLALTAAADAAVLVAEPAGTCE